VNQISRLRWWWQSVWGATMAGLGFRRSAVFGRGRAVGYRWARPGPPPDLSKVQRPTWLPPDGELGVAVGTRVVLVSEERFAIALVDCVAYSSGFEFTISYRSQDDIGREVLGFGLPPVPGRELEVGIEYPDGQHASSGTEAMSAHYEAFYEGREPPQPSGPLVQPQRGGGGGKRYDQTYWCWPLPPEGPITIAVQWPAAGIASTTVEVDASAIRRAGVSSGKLWSG